MVVPGIPHHVTQRGNRRLETFFSDEDYQAYRSLLMEHCAAAGVEVWAYCLMPNHVHLILVPDHRDGLRAALGETHRRYTRRINLQHDWRGHLWQERFYSFAMDEGHLLACTRYVELNPVRAGLADKPEDWAFSSARAHLLGKNDGLVKVSPLLDRITDWRTFLRTTPTQERLERFRLHARTGRPLGADGFIQQVEEVLKRPIMKRKRGPKPE